MTTPGREEIEAAAPAATATIPAAPEITQEQQEARRVVREWAQERMRQLVHQQFSIDWSKDPSVILMSVVRENLWWFRWVILGAFCLGLLTLRWGV